MRKFALVALATCVSYLAQAQESTNPPSLKSLSERPADHFMLQLAYNKWLNAPDSIDSHIGGFQRSANVYIMLDKPFKGNPKLSFAAGLGIGTNNIYFKKMIVDIASTSGMVPFRAVDSTDNFKKFKVSTAFLELPLELRFMAKPETPTKTVKGAIGIKLGTMLNAHTKGKILRNAAGTTINNYTVKESSKTYFNTTRIAGTARVGYGIFTLFGAYSFTSVFKDGVAPDMNGLQVGLTISGL